MKIGVIDSGIGGITTLNEMLKTTASDYYYFLDEENLPYSKKSKDELIDIAKNTIKKLSILDIELIVIACNTLTSASAVNLRKDNSIPVIGIEPAVKPALKECKRIVTLATSATLSGEKYQKLKESAKNVEIIDIVGDGIQELIEMGNIGGAITYLNKLLDGIEDIDGIVLGCTHYVYLKEYFEKLGIRTFDGNVGVARRVKSLVDEGDSLHSQKVLSGNMECCSKKCRDRCTNISRVFVHSTGKLPLETIAKYLKKSVFLW